MIFYSYMFSYVLMFFIPLLICSISYRQVEINVRNNILDTNLSMLGQTKDIMDARLLEVDKLVKQLSVEPLVLNYSHQYDEHFTDMERYYNVLELTKRLSLYQATNNFFINNFYIYFRKSNTVISSKAFYSMSNFYGTFFKMENIDYNQWNQHILNQHIFNQRYDGKYYSAMPIIFEEFNGKGIMYIESFSFRNSYPSDGYIAVLIDEKEVRQMLSNINLFKDGYIYIANKDNEIITFISKREDGQILPVNLDESREYGSMQKKIDGRFMTVVYVISGNNSWKYVVVVPTNQIMHRIKIINMIMWGGWIVAMPISGLLALYLSSKKSKPIKEMVQIMLGYKNIKDETDENEYNFLKNSIRNMLTDYKQLETTIEKQKPLLQSIFFERLLEGKYRGNAEINQFLVYANLDFNAKNYILVLIELNQYEISDNPYMLKELDYLRIIVKDVINSNLPCKGYVQNFDENLMALLLCFNEDVDTSIKKTENMIQAVYDLLHHENKIDITFACASICNHLPDLGIHYLQAKKVLEYKKTGNANDVLWFDQLPKTKDEYDYSIDSEIRLINLVITGNKEGALKAVNNIYNENILQKQLSPELIEQFSFAIKGTVNRIIKRIKVKDQILSMVSEMNHCVNIDTLFKMVNEILSAICDSINEEKDKNINIIIQKVIQYINDNYSDINLSLTSIADHFNISEKYLSFSFKDKTGENLSNYIEKVRIDKACELLSLSDMYIVDIAEKTGYTNDASFRRAFKRLMGVSPTDYRKQFELRDS